MSPPLLALLLETRLQIAASLLLPALAAQLTATFVWLFGSVFYCFINLFLCSLFCDVKVVFLYKI